MLKRSIMALLVIATLSTILITVFAISDNNNTSNIQVPGVVVSNASSTHDTAITHEKNANYVGHSSSFSTTVKHKTQVLILPGQAKKLAMKYIKQTGASAGTPVLVKEDGRRVYIVPVIDNKIRVGEIDIDAHNGKNLGGAGGAP